jgi:hypothetical protein
MMKRLRGRNLAHPGCLTGVTTGLTLGIILAGILAAKFNVAYNTVLLLWLVMTVGLGAVGWIVGAILTPRFPALPETEGMHETNGVEPTSPSARAEQLVDTTPKSESTVNE